MFILSPPRSLGNPSQSRRELIPHRTLLLFEEEYPKGGGGERTF